MKAFLFFGIEYGNFYRNVLSRFERIDCMGMRLNILLCCMLACMAGLLKAQTTTYEFLRNDVSARAAAMGGSFVSVLNDPSAVFYNPAALATVKESQASFGYARHLEGINSGFASYNQNVEGVGMMHAGVQYYTYGTMDRYDNNGTYLGTFGASDLAFSVSMARELDDNLYCGVTAKFIHSSIADYSSTGAAGDIGVVYVLPGNNPVTLGASATNVGTQLSTYDGTKEPLPLDVTIGATIKPQHLPFLLSFTFHKLTDKQEAFGDHFKQFSFGGELQLGKAVQFRAGYSNERRRELKIGTSAGMAGLSFGGGIALEKLRFDYAYSSLGDIGSLSRITVGINL